MKHEMKRYEPAMAYEDVPVKPGSYAVRVEKRHVTHLLIDRIYPRRTFYVRLEDFPAWVGEYGHLTDPEDGKPCELSRVVWGKGGHPVGNTFASYRWRRNSEHKATEFTIYAGCFDGSPVATWKRNLEPTPANT